MTGREKGAPNGDSTASQRLLSSTLVEQLLPKPQEDDGSANAEDKVREVALPQQFYLQQMADERTHIAADDTYDQIHATTLARTTHYAVGDIANEDARKDRPRREICNMSQHLSLP